MTDRLPIFVTKMPMEGYNLAIELSRMAMKKTQSGDLIRQRLRAECEADAKALIAVLQSVAVNFAPNAAANGYWFARAGVART